MTPYRWPYFDQSTLIITISYFQLDKVQIILQSRTKGCQFRPEVAALKSPITARSCM